MSSLTRLMIARVDTGALRAPARIDLHHQHVLGRGRAQERTDRRIAAVAAVPIGHAVDLDRAEQQRQAGRGHHHLGRDLLAGEHLELAGAHVGRRNEQLEIAVAPDRLEIDEALDQVLQRIDVERVEIVRRPEARERAEPRGLRGEREQPVDHAALQVRQMAVDAHRAPELGEPLPRVLGAAAREAVGDERRVDRARRGPGDALDLEPAVGQNLVEHAPGEGAVCAAALQREVDSLAGALRPQTPDHRPAAVRPCGGGK